MEARKIIGNHLPENIRAIAQPVSFLIFGVSSTISMIIFYIYFRSFPYWSLFLFALIIFLFGFWFSIYGLLLYLKEKSPSNPIAMFEEFGIALLLSSMLIPFFYYPTKSIIIAVTFYFFLVGGLYISRIREFKFINIILIVVSFVILYYANRDKEIFLYIISIIFLTAGMFGTGVRNIRYFGAILIIISIITFYYSYNNRDIFMYLFSTLVLLFMSTTVGKYLGKNLDDRDLMYIPCIMSVLSFSFSLLFYRFFKLIPLFLLGAIATVFFGFFFLELILISCLKNVLFLNKKDESNAFPLTFVLISTIVFLIFFFFRHSAIIYIIGSLCLSFGSMSSRLFLRKFLSEHLSFELSMCMMFGILGICTIIFYFIFINKLSILFLGIGLVIFALRIAYKEIKKDKLNIDFNRNP